MAEKCLCFMCDWVCVFVCVLYVRVWYQIQQKEMWGRVYPSILTSYIISFFWLQASPHPISFNILQYVRVLFHCTQCTTQYHKIIISHDFHRRRYYILLNRLFMPSSIFVSIRSLVIDTLLLYQYIKRNLLRLLNIHILMLLDLVLKIYVFGVWHIHSLVEEVNWTDRHIPYLIYLHNNLYAYVFIVWKQMATIITTGYHRSFLLNHSTAFKHWRNPLANSLLLGFLVIPFLRSGSNIFATAARRQSYALKVT